MTEPGAGQLFETIKESLQRTASRNWSELGEFEAADLAAGATEAAIRHAIAVLNRLHATDPTVLPRLVTYRVPCNEALADDETIQVGGGPEGPWAVGLVGVLNGIFGCRPGTSQGWLGANWTVLTEDDDGRIVPEDFTGFVILTDTGDPEPPGDREV